MKKARNGSAVWINYVGTLENGRIFDSTEGRTPLTFTLGEGQVFQALEQAVVGMRVGEVKNVVIPAAEAFGTRVEENILKLPRDRFPAGREIAVGQKLSIDFRGGKNRIMRVCAVTENEVTLDGNHPLAGCDLTFALELHDCSE